MSKMKTAARLLCATLFACAMTANAAVAAFAVQPGTDKLAQELFNDQYEVEDVGYSGPVVAKQDAVSCTFDMKIMDPAYGSYYKDFVRVSCINPRTGAEIRGSKGQQISMGDSAMPGHVWRFTCSGLVPGETYQFPVFSVYKIDGVEIGSSSAVATVKLPKMSAPTVKATKLSARKARVSVTMPQAMRVKGAFKLKCYAGSKRIKTMTSTTASSYSFSYAKKGAGKLAYKVVVAWAEKESTAVSASTKPAANVITWKRSTSAASYGFSTAECLPIKLSYNGKGKLVAKVRWVNTLLARASSKLTMKVSVKCQGKTIATQKFTSKSIKRMKTASAMLKFKKAKKGYDLRNGGLTWTAKLVKAK